MATDPKKRQKKLAQKTAKRKKALASKAKEMRGKIGQALSTSKEVDLAKKLPIHECLMADSLFEKGMGTVIVSRKMTNGRIGASFFLLDVFCLGVKNAFFQVLPEIMYRQRITSGHEVYKNIHPTCARKLVEGAEAYAADLGFKPHRDYKSARKIFDDINAEACPTTFEFGKDGKPFFMSGPYDTPERCEKIIQTLTKRCGPDGFEFITVLGPDTELLFDDDWDED